MKIAIGCYKFKDKYKLFPGEFGHSKYFVIYDLDKGEIEKIIENPYKSIEAKDKFKKIAELLKDVNFFVGYEFGKNAVKLEKLYHIKVIKLREKLDLENIIKKLKEIYF